jgi:hypothetical protein
LLWESIDPKIDRTFSWGRTSTCLPAMYDGKKFIATKSPKRHPSGVEASRKAWKTEARGAPVRGDGASTGTINDKGGASIGAEAPALGYYVPLVACAQFFVWGSLRSNKIGFSGLRMQIWRLDSLCLRSAAQGVVDAELSKLFLSTMCIHSSALRPPQRWRSSHTLRGTVRVE